MRSPEQLSRRVQSYGVLLVVLGLGLACDNHSGLQTVDTDGGLDSGVDGGSDAGVDAGPDAGADAGDDAGPDAGRDAGPDAGFDAGPDAGSDAGAPFWDGGLWVDAGPYPAVTCIDSSPLSSQNWTLDTTPLSLPADEGRLLSCYHTNSYNQSSAAVLAAPFLPTGFSATTGFEEYIIQYASQGPPGTLRHVTALVYLPNGGQTDAPLVSLSHATSGMGPNCGVTHITSYADYMALPLVTQGMAVVATDYPGMGVADGVSPYSIGWAEGMSVLDAARAASQIHDAPRFDSSQLSRQLLLVGHSQGGQSTLFAHQVYAQQNGPSLGLNLIGSVSFAPAYGDLRGIGDLVATAATPIFQDQFFLTMTLLAENAYFGGPALTDIFSSGAEPTLPALVESQCTVVAMPAVEMLWPTVGDLFSSTFASDFSVCSFDGGPCPTLAPWDENVYALVPGYFKSTEPALILQGESDTQVYPETTACITARLQGEGTPVQTCAFAGATHITVVSEAMGDVLTWIGGRLLGATPGVCDAGLIETCAP